MRSTKPETFRLMWRTRVSSIATRPTVRHAPPTVPLADVGGPQTNQLLSCRIDVDRGQTGNRRRTGQLVFVDRQVVHPHLVFAGSLRCLFGIHRRAIKEHSARRDGRPFVVRFTFGHLDQLHAADRAIARMVLDDGGVHRALVACGGSTLAVRSAGSCAERARHEQRACRRERDAERGDQQQRGEAKTALGRIDYRRADGFCGHGRPFTCPRPSRPAWFPLQAWQPKGCRPPSAWR